MVLILTLNSLGRALGRARDSRGLARESFSFDDDLLKLLILEQALNIIGRALDNWEISCSFCASS